MTEIAGLALSGRAGTGVVQVGAAPDITDVSSLGVRGSDGVSVYRPPGEERWCTVDHLDLEAHIVAQARQQVRQLVSEEQARRAVARTDLTPEQADAVVTMLTSRTMTVPFNAAAGSGKSHVMGVFAELWTRFTGARVIGLTTSTNAAEVLAHEGLAESYNIAEFLGKVEGSDELRYPVQVNPDDVLVLDEATQASTVDVGLVQQAARHAGARLHPVGDTEQLGAVEAGGIFSLLAEEIPGAQLEEIRRFRQPWQAEASQRLRKGEIAAIAAYDRRGRTRGADHETVFDQAAKAWLADYLRGRDALLLAGSSEEAADLSRRVQSQLAQLGRVGPGVLDLSDGNLAGLGDLIRARHNDDINAGGRPLRNRDRLLVMSVSQDGRDVVARRQIRPGEWTGAFRVPAAYLRDHGELDYAGNVHVSQGRTVDAGHLLVTQTLSRRSFYVGMTRGREENTAWVETGGTAPAGKKPYEQATVESVIKGVMEREAGEESATQQMRAGQEWAGGTGHLLHLWSVSVRETLYPAIDRQVTARLTPDQARRYQGEHARQAFHARLREAQLAGHDVGELVDRVTADSLDGARSVSSVLHSRLAGLGLDAQHDATWAQRTPAGVPDLARELADGLDERVRELGVRHADRPEPWLAGYLGVPGPAASPALRAEYERRAGIAASYREAAGITNPEQAISPDPHEGNPELETARKATMRALEMRDEAEFLRGLTRGQLEARVQEGERAMAAAPPDVSADLRLTGQAKQDAWAQNADAQARGQAAEAAGAEQLARLMEAREAQTEPQAASYEGWSADTAQVRYDAGKAREELASRGQPETPPPGGGGVSGGGGGPGGGGPEPGGELEWWREFEADLEGVGRALAAQHQAALDAGDPWPPPPWAEPRGGKTAEEAIAQLRADGYLPSEGVPSPAATPETPEPATPEPATAELPAPEPDGPPMSDVGPEGDVPAAPAGGVPEVPAAEVEEPAPAGPPEPARPQAPAPRVPDDLPERLPRSDAEWRLDNAKADREAAEASTDVAPEVSTETLAADAPPAQPVQQQDPQAVRQPDPTAPGADPVAATEITDAAATTPAGQWPAADPDLAARLQAELEADRQVQAEARLEAAEQAHLDEAKARIDARPVPEATTTADPDPVSEAPAAAEVEAGPAPDPPPVETADHGPEPTTTSPDPVPEPAGPQPAELAADTSEATPSAGTGEALEGQPEADRNARLDALQARASDAAGRIEAEREEAAAGARDYADRQAQADAGPEAGDWQAGVPVEEMEPEA